MSKLITLRTTANLDEVDLYRPSGMDDWHFFPHPEPAQEQAQGNGEALLQVRARVIRVEATCPTCLGTTIVEPVAELTPCPDCSGPATTLFEEKEPRWGPGSLAEEVSRLVAAVDDFNRDTVRSLADQVWELERKGGEREPE